jgi:hypothetical protein
MGIPSITSSGHKWATKTWIKSTPKKNIWGFLKLRYPSFSPFFPNKPWPRIWMTTCDLLWIKTPIEPSPVWFLEYHSWINVLSMGKYIN